jgi:Ser/Thr protein kinase RdoA (MazF antagonist)
VMSVGVMGRLVDEIDAGVLPDVARAAADLWWPGSQVRYVRSSSNHVFRVEAGSGSIGFLRVTPDEHRRSELVAREVDEVLALAAAGAAVSSPVRSLRGRLVESLSGGHGTLHATLVNAVAGSQVMEVDELTSVMARGWGQLLARLHETADRIGLRANDGPQGAAPAAPASGADDPALADFIADGRAWLRGVRRSQGDVGWIHGDCQADNLAWVDGRCVAFDFEDAACESRLVDVSVALDDAWDEHPEVVGAFLYGYESVRPLSGDPRAFAVRHRALRTAEQLVGLLEAYRDLPADPPPWLAAMRERHAAWMGRARHTLARPVDWGAG